MNIYFPQVLLAISIIWVMIRLFFNIKEKKLKITRELQLLLVYICFVVLARITLFPLETVNGVIQPLVLYPDKIFPFNVNFVPFIHLFEYEQVSSAIINFIGNVAMFIPVGVIYPAVYKKLDSHLKIISAGVGLSLFIEIIQLPFFDRVSDVDDLILNSLGYLTGYLIYLGFKALKRKK